MQGEIEAIGFSGLESIVLKNPLNAPVVPGHSNENVDAVKAAPSADLVQPRKMRAGRPPKPTGLKKKIADAKEYVLENRPWIALWIAAIVIPLIIGQSQSNAAHSTSAGYSAPSPYSFSQTSNAGEWSESKPMPGTDLVLSPAELRYCQAQNIRIGAGEAVLNKYNNQQIDLFNGLVNDYNIRCGQFRYSRGALENAKAAAESRRLTFEAEGRSWFGS